MSLSPEDAAAAAADTGEADRAIAEAAGSTFHLLQFLEQLGVQTTLPFSALYLVAARSVAAAANVLSVPRPMGCVVAIIFGLAQIMLTTPLVVFAAWSTPDAPAGESTAATAVLRADVLVVSAMFAMHRLAICIKYAFQPSSIYAKRMREWVSMQDRLDDQLFSAWFVLAPSTIDREVRAALRSLDDDEVGATFALSAEAFSRLRASLPAASQATLDAAGRDLPVSVLASLLLLRVNAETAGLVTTLQRTTTFFGMLATFATTVLRASLSLPVLGASATESAIIVGHWIADFLLLPTVFTFLSVGIVDHYRRQFVLDALARLMRSSPLRAGGGTAGMLSTAVRPPILPLETVADMRAFLAMRRLLINFGAGFHARLVTVLGFDLVVLTATAAVCVVSALTAPLDIGSISAPVLIFHVVVAPAVALCALGLYAAANANAAAARLASVVVQARLRLRLATQSEGDKAPPLTLALLDDIECTLREQTDPVAVLGVAATPALTSSLVGAFASVETVLVSGIITRWSSPRSATATLDASTGAATPSPSPLPSASLPPPPRSSGDSGGAASSLSTGEIIGIAIAACAVVCLLVAAASAVASRRAAPPLSSENPLATAARGRGVARKHGGHYFPDPDGKPRALAAAPAPGLPLPAESAKEPGVATPRSDEGALATSISLRNILS